MTDVPFTPIQKITLDAFENKMRDVIKSRLAAVNRALSGEDNPPPDPVSDVKLVLSVVQKILAEHVHNIGGRPDLMSATTFVLMGMQAHVEEAVQIIHGRVIETNKAKQPEAGPN